MVSSSTYLYEIETCMAAIVYEHLGTRRLYLSPRGGHTIWLCRVRNKIYLNIPPLAVKFLWFFPFSPPPPLLTIKNDWSLICLSHNAPGPYPDSCTDIKGAIYTVSGSSQITFLGFYECIYAYQLPTSGKRDILSSTELVFFFPMNFVKVFCKNLEDIPGYHH